MNQFTESVKETLHPSLYRNILRRIGVNIGRSASLPYLETRKTDKPYTAQNYVACIEGLNERLGLECSVAEGAVYPDDGNPPNGGGLETMRQTSLESLSLREHQILRLAGEGLSNRHIAAALHLSVRTVEDHLSRIHAKLEIKGRTDLIRLALRGHPPHL